MGTVPTERMVLPVVSLISIVSTTRECASCGKSFDPVDSRQLRCTPNCRRGRNLAGPVSFTAVDGEGLGADPSRYVLLGCGQEQLSSRHGLHWKECFEFLYSRYIAAAPGTAFVGFFLGYDYAQILKTLPEDRARMLFTTAGQALRKHKVPGKEPHPVEYDRWQFDILGSKRLRIRPKRCNCVNATCHCDGKASWMYLCDVGPFWQTSFLNVIDPSVWPTPIVTPSEYALIKEGKENRSSAVLDADMMRYNRLENEILERAMTALNVGYESIGIHLTPKEWMGPGQSAAKWLRPRIIKSRELFAGSTIPLWYRDAARQSYFGGWFEDMMHGHIPGVSHEYDINSAYPAAIATLPCLLHGRYSHGEGTPLVDPGDLCLVRARVWTRHPATPRLRGSHDYVGAALHRLPNGNITRPLVTEGWYWWSELEAARRAQCITGMEVYEYANYTPCECPAPFREIAALYEHRLSVGKDCPEGKSCKLCYNAMYGKFAQSVGSPPFGNPIYASRITAECRTAILEAIRTHPLGVRGVIQVATDAVFFLTPHLSLTIGSGLGEWSHTPRAGLTIFKPGVYWDDNARAMVSAGESPKFKSRGVNAAELGRHLTAIDDIFTSFGNSAPSLDSPLWPSIDFHTSFAMVSPLQALARGNWTLCGIMERDPVTGTPGKTLRQNATPASKRTAPWYDADFHVLRTQPHDVLWDDSVRDFLCTSTPYTKQFGLDDPWSEESRGELGFDYDGDISDLFSSLLKKD